MPLTAPAHQAVVLPLKLLAPDLTDATALCIAAAAPDLGYGLMGGDSHTAAGVVVFAVPFTLIACAVLRWRAAATVFANVADLGPFRLRSYRVIVERRPPIVMTVLCALIGAVSHVVLDAFTHPGRWGARWLGLDSTTVLLPVRGEVTVAQLLQYVGHTAGSLLGILLFLHIGRRRLLEQWYGGAAVQRARRVALLPRDRVAFWATAAATAVAVSGLAVASGSMRIFAVFLGATVGLLVAGSVRRTAGRALPVRT